MAHDVLDVPLRSGATVSGEFAIRSWSAEQEELARWLLHLGKMEQTDAAILQMLESGRCGKPEAEVVAENLFVNSGRNALRDLILYPQVVGPGYTPDYIAVGTSSAVELATDTVLGAEVFRKQMTQKRATATGVGLMQVFIATTEANGSGSLVLTEAGAFDLASAGTMWDRSIFAGVTKSSSVALTVTLTLTINAG